MSFDIGRLVLGMSVFISSTVFAGDPMTCNGAADERKWDLRCEERAKEYLATGAKTLNGEPSCARLIPQTKIRNPRCRWYPMRVSHVPGYIAEAFHSRTKENREIAFEYLENFCQRNPGLCSPYFAQLDGEVKGNILAWRKSLPALAVRAEKLRDDWRAGDGK